MTDKLTPEQREAFEHAFRQTQVVDKRNEHYSEIIAEIYFLAGYRAAQSAQPPTEIRHDDANHRTHSYPGRNQPNSPGTEARLSDTRDGVASLTPGQTPQPPASTQSAQPAAVGAKLSDSELATVGKMLMSFSANPSNDNALKVCAFIEQRCASARAAGMESAAKIFDEMADQAENDSYHFLYRSKAAAIRAAISPTGNSHG